jgi:trimeric autotransporter adhesin
VNALRFTVVAGVLIGLFVAPPTWAGPNSSALDVTIGSPGAVVADMEGNVFFSSPNVIFKLDTSGVLTQIAGGWTAGYAGDGGPATQALLDIPFQYPELTHDPIDFGELVGALAVDSVGSVYIADAYNNRIRKIDANGTISTVAGMGESGWVAPHASLHIPQGVAVDAAGNLFISDSRAGLLKMTRDGVIHLVTGNNCGRHPDPGLCAPEQVAIDLHGVVYVADGYCDVRKVGPDGSVTEVAGDPRPSASNANWTCGYSGDGGSATTAALSDPYGVVVDSAYLYIADTYNSCIRRVDANGVIATVAGVCESPGYSGDGGPARAAKLNLPHGVAVDAAGNLYIADTANNRLRKVTPDGTISTVAGNGSPAPVPADQLLYSAPAPVSSPPISSTPVASSSVAPASGGGGAMGLAELGALLTLAIARCLGARVPEFRRLFSETRIAVPNCECRDAGCRARSRHTRGGFDLP